MAMHDDSAADGEAGLRFLAGGGAMGERIRRHAWAATSLGEPGTWPASLRTVVRLMLTSNHPMYIFWGDEGLSLYNDAYSRSLGPEKHPAILGLPARRAWPEIWELIGPQIELVMQGRGATWHENDKVPIVRNGGLEDVWWTYSYGPIDDEQAPHGVGGVLVLTIETTAQVQTERLLAESGARWRSWFEHTPGFVCVLTGPSHRFDYANPRYGSLVGGRALLGLTVEQALPEAASQGFVALLDGVYRSGQPYVGTTVPLRLDDTDGTQRLVHLDFVYQPIRDAEGRVNGIFVQGSDVSDRVLAQTAMTDSELRYRTLAEQMPGGAVFVVDTGLRFVMAAGEALTTVGYSPADLVGRTVQEAVDPAVAPAVERDYRQALAGQSFEVEHASGPRFFLTRGAPLRDGSGRIYGVMAVSFDITSRRLAEERLRSARAQLDGVMAAAEVGVWTWDLVQDSIEQDQNFARLYGLPPRSTATPEEHVERIHAEDRALMRSAVQAALEAGRLDVREYRVTDRDGVTRWLSGRGRVQYGADGRAERLTGLVIDITELKQLEESLKASDRQKDEFLAVLAHELRNPLAPLMSAARVLEKDPLDAATLANCRDIIRRQVQQMALLLDDLLDISRIKHGRLRLTRAPVPLAEVVAAAVETAAPWIEARGHAFAIRLPEPPAVLDADAGRMAQVLANLLGNAAKYTEGGGRIELLAQRVGAMVEIAVRDNGIGLSEADQAHVFQMFAQVDHEAGREQGGLGIGLALVKGLVELHGGRVRVASPGLGQGSTFTVTVPALAPAAALPTAAVDSAGSIGVWRILVADDNTDAADTLAMFLQLEGHETQVVHDGAQALAAVAAACPDVALVDIGMPLLSGYEVARRVRAGPADHQPVLVALTGWGQENDKLKAQAAGFDLHFTKPVDPQALLRALADRLPPRR